MRGSTVIQVPKRYYRTLMGYCVLCPVVYGLWIFLFLDAFQSGTAESVAAMGAIGGFAFLALVVMAIASYGALFKDAIYLREIGGRWRPKWSRYFVYGSGPPIAVALVGSLGDVVVALGFALLTFPLTTLAIALLYLYRRHEMTGIP